jgi:hypothetical protein
MKILTSFIILSSVLVACSQEDEVAQNPITPFYSQAQLSFVGTDLKDRRFGHNVDLSQVDCQYDPDTTTLKMVAYTFEEKATQGLKIKETIQLTDPRFQTVQSSSLQASDTLLLPPFIFMGEDLDLKHNDSSHCSTRYEMQGDEITGRVVCWDLEIEGQDEMFVSLEFQCRTKGYLLFEVQPEMVD